MLEKFEQKMLLTYMIKCLENTETTYCDLDNFVYTVNKMYTSKHIDFYIGNLEDIPKKYRRKSSKRSHPDFEIDEDSIIEDLTKSLKAFKNVKISNREEKIRIIGEIFNLTDVEIEIFGLLARLECSKTFMQIFGRISRRKEDILESTFVGNTSTFTESIRNLKDYGLISQSEDSLASDRIYRIVYGSKKQTKEEIIQILLGKSLKPALRKKDFEHIKNEFNMVKLILKNAIEQRTKGINILFYGEVGTGKTEMAKTIAKCLKVPLYETIYEDSDEDEANRYQRINDLKRKEKIFSHVDTKQLVLFDEAEDVFSETLYSRKTESKAFVNKILEENPTPVIWTTNDIEHMDRAYLRRFSYSVKFEKLTDDVQLRFMKKEFKKNKFELPDKEILALSKKYDLSSSTISNSIKLTQLTNSSNDKFEYFLNNQMVLLNRGNEASENFNANKRVENYNFKLVNTDTNMEELAQKIKNTGKLNFSLCLYGEAGTGKSEYAKQLADKLGIEVIFKRASDLISKWVGETEQNIARAFKEARDKKAMLIFDEADSLLQSRGNAQRSWEISQVNEMLTWMESHPYPFICTTNFMDTLDEASLRRFTFKIKFKYMTKDQVKLAFKHFFDKEVSDEVANINGLTAGDFATVCKKISFLGSDDVYELKHMLEEEVKVKKSKELSSNVGF